MHVVASVKLKSMEHLANLKLVLSQTEEHDLTIIQHQCMYSYFTHRYQSYVQTRRGCMMLNQCKHNQQRLPRWPNRLISTALKPDYYDDMKAVAQQYKINIHTTIVPFCTNILHEIILEEIQNDTARKKRSTFLIIEVHANNIPTHVNKRTPNSSLAKKKKG